MKGTCPVVPRVLCTRDVWLEHVNSTPQFIECVCSVVSLHAAGVRGHVVVLEEEGDSEWLRVVCGYHPVHRGTGMGIAM